MPTFLRNCSSNKKKFYGKKQNFLFKASTTKSQMSQKQLIVEHGMPSLTIRYSNPSYKTELRLLCSSP